MCYNSCKSNPVAISAQVFQGASRHFGSDVMEEGSTILPLDEVSDSGGDTLPTFGELLETLAPAYAVVDSHDVEMLCRLQVVAKAFMERSAQQTCRVCGSRPLLMVYGSDLTPMLHAFSTAVNVGGKNERRTSKQPTEWCLHKAFSCGEMILARRW